VALLGTTLWRGTSKDSHPETSISKPAPVVTEVANTTPEKAEVDWIDRAHQLTMPSRREYTLPLNNPDTVPGNSATHMEPDDLVVGVTLHGHTRAYPWWILSNYHVVNDTMTTNTEGDVPIYIGLCEQCSGAAAFIPIIKELPLRPLSFQVSGISAGTIEISDVQTLSQWHPFSGEAVSGPLKGRQLEPVPFVLERWDVWKRQHPHSDVVLGSLQMRRRPHGMSHGASLGHPHMPDFFAKVANLNDKRLPGNALVYGLMTDKQGSAIAIRHRDIKENGFLELEFKETPILLHLVGEHGVRAFVRELDGQALTFTLNPENPRLLNDQFGSVWNEMGEAIGGRQALAKSRLRLARGYLTEWYEWVSNVPQTELYNPVSKPNASLPAITISDEQGKPFPLTNLQGRYTVLVFGCTTSTIIEANSAQLETVYRDYLKKKVNFFYVYKSLANPGMSGFISPITMDERVTQAKHAKQRLGSSIPWLSDNMANEFAAAASSNTNTELIIDKSGKIIQRRHWVAPELLRQDLAQLVGEVTPPTSISDIQLKIGKAMPTAPKNVTPPLEVPYSMVPLQSIALEGDKRPFLAKLIVEAEPKLLTTGSGMLYLGFYLDPIYGGYWNNALPEFSYEVTSSSGIALEPSSGHADKVNEPKDIDPREFLLTADGGSAESEFEVTVRYEVFNDRVPFQEKVTQSYKVSLVQDSLTGSRVPRLTPQFGDGDIIAKFLENDADSNGSLSQTELPPGLRNGFQKMDLNGDGQVSVEEMKPVEKQLLHQQNYQW
jgi:hypothetical protein